MINHLQLTKLISQSEQKNPDNINYHKDILC